MQTGKEDSAIGRARLVAAAILLTTLLGSAFALSAYAAVFPVTGLDSPTHPVPTTWYSDDSPAFTWDDPYPELLGSTPAAGLIIDGDTSGDILYVADAVMGLRTFDISDPSAPAARSALPLADGAYAVDVVGDVAYLVGSGGVHSVDVSEVGTPTVLDSEPAEGLPLDISAVGHVGYVAAGDAGVLTYDISHPQTLTILGAYETSGTARAVAVAGGVAYVADSDAGLLLVDTSEPGTLTPLAALSTSGSANGVALSGLTAYVANGADGLLAVDVSQSGAPAVVGSIETSGTAIGVDVLGDVAYVAMGPAGVAAIDVSDPSAMRYLGMRETDDIAYAAKLVGNECYVSGGSAGIEVLEVSEPVGPTLLDHEPSNYAAYVDVEGDTVHIADWGSLYMLDVSDPASMTPEHWFASSGSYTCEVDGAIAYVANGWSGVRVLDVSDPMAPTQLALFNTSDYATRVSVLGNVAYIADFRHGIHAVDVSDPTAPVLLDTYNTPGYAYAVRAVGTTVWVGDYQAGIRALDASDPTNLVSLGSYNTPGNAYDIELAGDVAYVADVGGGLLVFDVSDPSSIALLAQRSLSGTPWDVSIQGDQLMVADDDGISVLDISDPTSPSVTGSVATPGRSVAVDTDGDVAYLGSQTAGVRSFQISDYKTGFSRAFDMTPTTVPELIAGDAYPAASYSGVADGEWYFHVRSVGRFGSAQAVEHRMVRIDTTAPNSTASAPVGWQSSDAQVSLVATDALSGVDSTHFRLDDGPQMSYAGTFTVTAEGTTTVSFHSTDIAGNREETRTATVLIDKTPPVTTHDVFLAPSAPATITLTPTDALSGVAETYYTFGGAVMTGTVVPVTAPGPYALHYWSVDNVGNVEATRTIEYTAETQVVRRGGRDRYATAVEISSANFTSADQLILATGWTYADALSASGLAGVLEAPILITRPESLPADIVAEIARLGPSKITIVGGTFAVSKAIEDHLRDALGYEVERIWGSDRYETSARISEHVRAHGADAGRVFIASGEVGADALSLSPLVYSAQAPLLLTRKNSVPSSTEEALRAEEASVAVLAGGSAAVSDENVARMEAMVGTSITRLWGHDRYETAAAVSRYGVAEGLGDYEYLGVANGSDVSFPDSLCGGAAIGTHGGVMTLTRAETLPTATRSVMNEAQGIALQVQVFGGTGVVSEGVMEEIRSIFE